MTTETKFHCCSEWHLARLTPISFLVYPFALRLSKTHGGKFSYPASLLADFFNYDEWTVRQSYKELEQIGFFRRVETRMFEANVYKVLTHEEWATGHPEQCATKTTNPWTGEGDTLGQALYVASGSAVKLFENQIKCLRSLGLPEAQIVSEFEAFWTEQVRKSQAGKFKSNRAGIVGRFLLQMKARYGKQAAVAAKTASVAGGFSTTTAGGFSNAMAGGFLGSSPGKFPR